ncbi:MAG: hydroxyacid dehydrogenase [Elusimicrobia bacterium CG_4_9_14_3_um_filter_62_55]|nr:MAG: hydroxyacid dehydrogenase [Elusimicrobia bacterium CG22_combo_CG10-13_8_21_14_all_63_91]PJA14213.1 MAG: hydroxyacid dehydrogenase [Elusimicrobia bacterium CG_4_10_14_0_2_um_filter_63_34]PJB24592.1 MAG: hydroxyacid dehydrogenase [Elusimicrobia bacterium CG_4_9_14_3_um_filter_62_55]
MIETKGYAALAAKKPLEPFTFSRREPGDEDVLIDIRYCGICHSDIHQARDEWGGSAFPMVPGHEILGTVLKVGANVSRFKEGDTVGVGCFVDSCRSCAACAEGLEQYCENGMVLTYNGLEKDQETATQGGYSTRIVVDHNFLLRVPDSIKPEEAAPLMCAGITLYSPLKHWGAGPGKKVGIVGMGGLGHMGVKIAAAMGAEVTVFSHSEKKKDDALAFGARAFVAGMDEATAASLAGSFDLIVDTVSAEHDMNLLLSLLKREASLVLVGVPEQPHKIAPFPLIGGRRNLSGSLIGGIAETQEMLDFCGKHSLGSQVEIVSPERINEAYERVVRSDVRYRFVVDLAPLK